MRRATLSFCPIRPLDAAHARSCSLVCCLATIITERPKLDIYPEVDKLLPARVLPTKPRGAAADSRGVGAWMEGREAWRES